jgi:hypothetical protein
MISKLPTMLRSKSKSNKSKIEQKLLRQNRKKGNSKKMPELLKTEGERKKLPETILIKCIKKKVKINKKWIYSILSKTKPPTARNSKNCRQRSVVLRLETRNSKKRSRELMPNYKELMRKTPNIRNILMEFLLKKLNNSWNRTKRELRVLNKEEMTLP